MKEPTPKRLRNESLREKFRLGMRVQVPRQILQQLPYKSSRLPAYREGTVVEAGNRGVPSHYRFAVEVRFESGDSYTIWEEWALEKLVEVPVK